MGEMIPREPLRCPPAPPKQNVSSVDAQWRKGADRRKAWRRQRSSCGESHCRLESSSAARPFPGGMAMC